MSRRLIATTALLLTLPFPALANTPTLTASVSKAKLPGKTPVARALRSLGAAVRVAAPRKTPLACYATVYDPSGRPLSRMLAGRSATSGGTAAACFDASGAASALKRALSAQGKKFDNPLIAFDNPIISFDNPLIAFDNPLAARKAPSLSIGKVSGQVRKDLGRGTLRGRYVLAVFVATPDGKVRRIYTPLRFWNPSTKKLAVAPVVRPTSWTSR